MFYRNKYILIFLVVCLQFCTGNKILVRRFNYDARLYEHFALNSRFIQYSRTNAAEWMNITAMADARNYTFASMICTLGPGAWIFYPDPDYQMGNEQYYYLVIGEHCVRADGIESIQPLGKQDEGLEQGIILFEQPLFASGQTLITEQGGGEAGSLVFTGSQSYLIEGNGQKICLRPGISIFEDGYCVVPDLKTAFDLDGAITVNENCTDDGSDPDEKKVVVQSCYLQGVHEIYADQDFKIDNMNEICTGNPNEFLKSKFSFVLQMWQLRKDPDIQTMPMPENLEDQHKEQLEIFWTALQIFGQVCPDFYGRDINEEGGYRNFYFNYLYQLGNVFVMHLKNFWMNNNTSSKIPRTPPDQWEMAGNVLTDCFDNIPKEFSPDCDFGREYPTSEEKVSTTTPRKELFKRLVEPNEGFSERKYSWYEIVNGEVFDPVIEQIWLIINTVIPTCAPKLESNDYDQRILPFLDNSWSDLVLLFRDNFLNPLTEQWADPKDWRKVYSTIFRGSDMREAHKSILSCLGQALLETPKYDPIGRPKKLREYMLYKHTLPEHGKIDWSREKRKAEGKLARRSKGPGHQRTRTPRRHRQKTQKPINSF